MEPEQRLWLFALSALLILGGLILWGRERRARRSLIRRRVRDGCHRVYEHRGSSLVDKLLHRLLSRTQRSSNCHGDSRPEHDEICDWILVSHPLPSFLFIMSIPRTLKNMLASRYGPKSMATKMGLQKRLHRRRIHRPRAGPLVPGLCRAWLHFERSEQGEIQSMGEENRPVWFTERPLSLVP